jgi:hypothetical protein
MIASYTSHNEEGSLSPGRGKLCILEAAHGELRVASGPSIRTKEADSLGWTQNRTEFCRQLRLWSKQPCCVVHTTPMLGDTTLEWSQVTPGEELSLTRWALKVSATCCRERHAIQPTVLGTALNPDRRVPALEPSHGCSELGLVIATKSVEQAQLVFTLSCRWHCQDPTWTGLGTIC